MYYGKINTCDIANGEGVRVSLFVSGCRNHCEGCFNQETWNFKFGKPFDEEAEKLILDALDKPYIDGLTILGGEPFEKENQKDLLPFILKAREKYPNKTIWAYSGYTYDIDMQKGGKVYSEYVTQILENIDILVDGKFDIKLYNLALKFRGSSNQRIIDMKETLKSGNIVLSKLNEYKDFKIEE